ncbi:unnamed protein product [Urochloa humidicola]
MADLCICVLPVVTLCWTEIVAPFAQRNRCTRNHHAGIAVFAPSYTRPSASVEEALKRIRCRKRQRDQFCPLLSEETSKKRRLSRINKRKQRLLVGQGLAAFVSSFASRDIIHVNMRRR